MKPKIKRLDASSPSSLDELCVEGGNILGFWINASIGPDDSEAADDFQIFVCNREWLEGEGSSSGRQVNKFLLVEGVCDSHGLMKALDAYLSECAGITWVEVVERISRVGSWEFEGYQP